MVLTFLRTPANVKQIEGLACDFLTRPWPPGRVVRVASEGWSVGVLSAIRRFFGFEAAEDDEESLLPAPVRQPSPTSTAFRVGEKLSIKGEIVGEGDLELAGRFEGVVNVQGTVVIGDRAEVDADITASTIVVGGKVRGNLSAAGRVEILPQGVLTGNLKGGSVAAADGASVKGEIVVERPGKGKLEASPSP
jgi:cytoskeletal protein CcmA (bactofilin family)